MTELQPGANGAFILKTQGQIHKVLKVGVKMQLELLAGARTPISLLNLYYPLLILYYSTVALGYFRPEFHIPMSELDRCLLEMVL